MARKPSIIYQVIERLKSLQRFGQSKHAAKQLEKERCRQENRRWNPARVEGIYSFKTYEVYKEHCLDFANWVRAEKGVKTLEQAREHAGEYLKLQIDEGKSAWTVRVKAAALAKLFGCASTDFGVDFPRRSRKDIYRSRLEREHDRHFSEHRNKKLVDFCRATGLRRKELKKLTWRDVYKGEDGRVMVHVEQGKGGRTREVPVVRGMEEAVWAVREEARAAGREKLFPHVPNRADVHSYRREYAAARYRELEAEGKVATGELYRRRDGRKFDRGILLAVSRDLGHNRVDVVARHYLD